jgi:hypothetical protein
VNLTVDRVPSEFNLPFLRRFCACTDLDNKSPVIGAETGTALSTIKNFNLFDASKSPPEVQLSKSISIDFLPSKVLAIILSVPKPVSSKLIPNLENLVLNVTIASSSVFAVRLASIALRDFKNSGADFATCLKTFFLLLVRFFYSFYSLSSFCFLSYSYSCFPFFLLIFNKSFLVCFFKINFL